MIKTPCTRCVRSFARLVAVFALMLAALCAPTSAFAETANNVPYIDEKGVERTAPSATVVKFGIKGLDAGWYVVQGKVTIDQRFGVSGDVHLILADGATLDAPQGIEVAKGSHLHVYGQKAQTGALDATKGIGDWNCAIGPTAGQDGGDITINGGVVSAKSTGYPAAIGGASDKKSGAITINGGIVNAIAESADGDSSGAAIGGGVNGWTGPITINGGTVHAQANADGAFSTAIGAANQSSARGGVNGDVTLSGGVISCEGGIGVGYGDKPIKIVVDGAVLNHDGVEGIQTIYEERSGLINDAFVGSFTLPIDYTISAGSTLTYPEGETLTIADGVTLTNKGTIKNYGAIAGEGTIDNRGTIYTMSELPQGTNGTVVRGPSLEVKNGKATVDGVELPAGKPVPVGTTVSVSCDAPADGERFFGWIVPHGELKDVDLTAQTLMFEMPRDFLVLESTYGNAAAKITAEDGTERFYPNLMSAQWAWQDMPNTTMTVLSDGDTIKCKFMPEGGVLDLGGHTVEAETTDLDSRQGDLTIRNGTIKFMWDFTVASDLSLHFYDATIAPKYDALDITVEGKIIDEGGLVVDPRVRLVGKDGTSEGGVTDGIEPVISGVIDGETYADAVTVTVSDANLATVTVNGEKVALAGSPLGATIPLAPGKKDETYVIVATDEAGNETTVTVTVKAAPVDPDGGHDGDGQGGDGGQDQGGDDGQGGGQGGGTGGDNQGGGTDGNQGQGGDQDNGSDNNGSDNNGSGDTDGSGNDDQHDSDNNQDDGSDHNGQQDDSANDGQGQQGGNAGAGSSGNGANSGNGGQTGASGSGTGAAGGEAHLPETGDAAARVLLIVAMGVASLAAGMKRRRA